MGKVCRFGGAIAAGWIGLLCVLLAAESAVQQPPPTPPVQAQAAAEPKPIVGTGKISGIAVAADTGAPIKRATVMITGGTVLDPATGRPPARGAVFQLQPAPGGGRGVPYGMVSKNTETDASGGFAFSGLPAGRYTVNLSVRSGFVRPSSESIQVTEGGTARVTFKLDRTGAITGKVFDESGDPQQGAMLRASRWESVGGVRRLGPYYGGGFATNDLGEFRLYDLPPGDYYVAASMPTYGMATPLDLAEAQEPRFGFAPTFYPGTASPGQARTVTVRPGQDTPGIDITLLRARMGRVVATILDSTGAPAEQRASVGIASRMDAASSGGGMVRQRDGTYRSTDLPPGEYIVWAQFMRGEGQAGVMEGAAVPATINGDEITVHLQMNTGATVSGRVVIEGKVPDPVAVPSGRGSGSSSRPMVSARSVNTGTAYMPAASTGRGATAAEDGTFELKGLRGTMRIVASGPRLALKAVRQGTQDILAKPLELAGTERLTDVEIVLTSEVGSMEGTVTDAKGSPAAGAYVLIFSDDPTQWFETSPHVRQATAATTPIGSASPGAAPGASPGVASGTPVSPVVSAPTTIPGASPSTGMRFVAGGGGSRLDPGSFSTQSLLPGRYGVVAFERSGTTMPAYDPEALEKLRARATWVTVKAGEPARVEVRTIRQ